MELLSGECHRTLLKWSQHWNQTITWPNVNPDLSLYMVPPDLIESTSKINKQNKSSSPHVCCTISEKYLGLYSIWYIINTFCIYLITAEWHIYASVISPSLVQIMACHLVSAQAIISTNAGILFIRNLGTSFSSEIWIKIQNFSFKKMHLKTLWNGCHFVRGRWVNPCLVIWIFYHFSTLRLCR